MKHIYKCEAYKKQNQSREKRVKSNIVTGQVEQNRECQQTQHKSHDLKTKNILAQGQQCRHLQYISKLPQTRPV